MVHTNWPRLLECRTLASRSTLVARSAPVYPSGWYLVRLLTESSDQARWGEALFWSAAESGAVPVLREPFRVHGRTTALLVQIPEAVTRITVEWPEGEQRSPVAVVEMRAIPRAEWWVRSIRKKFQLIRQFGCVGPVLRRGAKLFFTGRWREIRHKLQRGVADQQTWNLAQGAEAHEQAAIWEPRPTPSHNSDEHRRPAEWHLAGDLTGLTGYDHIVHALLSYLPGLGLPIEPHPASRVRPDLLPRGTPLIPQIAAGRLPRLIVAPPFRLVDLRPTPRDVVLTMWENETLRPEWVRALNQAGWILTPSAWGQNCFQRAGVQRPVQVVPLGYDPSIFQPTPPSCGRRSLQARCRRSWITGTGRSQPWRAAQRPVLS